MQKLLLSCPNDGRKLRLLITALLKKWIITEALVLNSLKHYTLLDSKVKKQEKKLISLTVYPEKREQLMVLMTQISGWQLTNGDIQLLD